MKDKKTLLAALRSLKVQTGSLACLGCGYEHNCSTQGCAILREAELVAECSLVHQCRNCDFYEGGLYPRCFNKKSICVGRVMRPEDGCAHCSIDLLAKSEEARSDLAKQLAATQQRADRLLADLKESHTCAACIHVDTIPDCECECLNCEITCPCAGCRDSSNFKWRGDNGAPMTNGDRFRRYTDEELVELLYQHYLSFTDRGGAEDPSTQWCDMKGGCEGKEGSVCSPEQLKACILRWLQLEAERSKNDA